MKISCLLLASILFFSNCSNDNGVEEMLSEPIVNITEADLVGDWLFESLEFKDSIYFDCDKKLSREYNLLNLSFLNVTLESEYNVPTLIYYSDCGNDNTIKEEMKFKIKDKKIILNDNDKYGYLLLNFHDFDGETLIIKSLLNAPKAPTGGIYT